MTATLPRGMLCLAIQPRMAASKAAPALVWAAASLGAAMHRRICSATASAGTSR